MKKTKTRTHNGVYGICTSDEELLVILKSRGPYKGKYDLPGGEIESMETAEDALKREFEEETGCPVLKLEFFMSSSDEFSYKSSSGEVVTFRHTGTYYIVEIDENCHIKKNPDGRDSLGAAWVKLEDVFSGSVPVPDILKKVSQKLNCR